MLSVRQNLVAGALPKKEIGAKEEEEHEFALRSTFIFFLLPPHIFRM
jgi:hypothetical protein